ncbi:MAG: ribonuclease HI family protein [Anaerolineales bacterium]|nr:ribonuclease HI family protein [Anaerolineales bacterium]
MMYVLEFDGLFRKAHGRNHTGFMGFGWLLFQDNTLVAEGYGVAARGNDATSMVAEYLALVDGLEMLLDMGITAEPVVVLGDARVIIDQMKGISHVNSLRIQPLYHKAKQLSEQLWIMNWQWVRRKQNKAADALSRQAMRELRLDQEGFAEALDTIKKDREIRHNHLHILAGMQVVHRHAAQPVYAF